jgi:hypothetical protein
MGRSSIIYVIGLSLIVGVVLRNINERGTTSQDSYITYYGRTMAHNIVLAGANVGANRALFNSGYNTPFAGNFAGGTYAVRYDSLAPMQKTMTVHSQYNAGVAVLYDTLVATFEYTRFSRYIWFTDREENGYVSPTGTRGPYYGARVHKITGDSIMGVAHTNGRFYLSGSPYFEKKVTGGSAPIISGLNGKANPQFNEGYEWGRTVPRDTANILGLRALANVGSALPTGLFTNNDVGLEFFSNGNVRVRVPFNTGTLRDTTLPVSNLTTTGVIGAWGGDMHVKGTYRGQVTIAAFKGSGSSGANKGNCWIDGNIVAADNPRTNPSSLDMLGLVSERMCYVTRDNNRSSHSTLDIQAAIYCHTGEFTAQDFWLINPSGRINLYGGLCQRSAGAVGIFGSSGITNGFYKSYRHDPRFLRTSPPSYPFSTKYRLLSWWEN